MNFTCLPLLFPALTVLNAQTIPSLDGYEFNIDILPLTDLCVNPGDTFSFEVVTRIGAGNNTGFALGNIDYSIDLGVSRITFQGMNADGSFRVPLASTNGAVSGFMVDAADADNEFLPSTLSSDFGLLRADDGLERIDPSNSTWDADWVIRIDWTVPLDATPGTYAVTAEEEVDIFTAAGQFEDQGIATFPGAHTPFSIKVVPEPSTLFFSGLAMAFAFWRRTPSSL